MSHWRELLDAPSVQRRFWSKVTMTPDCWLWTASKVMGYGQFYVGVVDGRRAIPRAHQVAWEMSVGPRNPDLVLDHLCRERACVNVLHLEEVTNAENIRRSPIMRPGRRRRKYERLEFCRSGRHRLAETAIEHLGRRLCGTCRKEWTKTWEQTRRRKSA